MRRHPHPPDPITVLHVDAYEPFTEVTATFLERTISSFEVRTARTAGEALDAVTDGDVDCVVSGYELPIENGLALLEDVRDVAPNLPFVMLTAKRGEAVERAALGRGATAYVRKEGDPEQFERLATAIAAAVSDPSPPESPPVQRPRRDAPRRQT